MKHLYLITTLLCFLANTSRAQLTVTGGNPAAALVDSLVGTGVTVSNITYTGAAASKGTYKCTGGCNLGSTSGIFLTSGNAGGTPTFPPNVFHSDDMGTGADAQLNAIVAPDVTLDASVLEFDFVAATDSVSFRYVFASEEYNEWVNTNFNDVFAFFVSGPGIVGTKNVAIVPGTASTPVSIDNVNNGNAGGTASGPCQNCAYYTDNVGNGGQAIFFDGFTHVLTAGFKVYPCEVYHMKFAVADVNDHIYDSGVFLEANSFSSNGSIHIFANGTQYNNLDTIYACPGDVVTLSVNTATNYNWNTGANTQSITVTQATLFNGGHYQCAILNFGVACFAYTNLWVMYVNPSATITPSGPTNLCPGDSVTLVANPGNSYLWSNGATTQSITVGTAGNYTVTVTMGPSCSATSTPTAVTIAAPAASISGTLVVCSGINTTLTATAGASYLWSTGATTQSISVGTAGPYTVTVTFNGGCTAGATANVTVNTLPSTTITGTTPICQGANTTLDAGAGFASYLWSTGAVSQTITTNTANTYTCTITNAAGCSASASLAVVVNPLPTPAITGTSTFCSGNNSNLNAGAGYSSYLWSTGAVTQLLNITAAGTYTVTVTNGFGCTATTSQLVTVNANPTPVISGTLSFCAGTNTTLNAGAGYTNYLWSTGATTQTITPTTANTFTVTVTNVNGCTGSTNAVTTINPLPTPAITGTNVICAGANTSFNAGAGYANYLWSTGAITQSITINTAGTFTVTVTDANGCTATTARTLTVNPLPTPAITGTSTFCSGSNSNLNAGAGYTSYLWSTGAATQTLNVTTGGTYTVTVSNGFGCTASTSQLVTVNANPTPVISGTLSFCTGGNTTINAGAGYTNYLWSNGATTQTITPSTANTFTVTVTSANGCTGTTNAVTTINPLPTPAITGTNVICSGSNATFDAGAGYANYLWSTGATTQTVSLNTASTYTVTVTDANGCSAATTRTLTVNPLPTPAITGNSAFCSGLSSTLNAGAGYSSYTWSTGANTQTISVSTAANYTVTVTNGFGCTASTSQLVTVHALPTPAITGPAGICTGSSATLNAGAGFTTYLWSTGAATQTISPSAAGTYTVTVTNANNCTASTTKALSLFALPTPAITGTNVICAGTNSTFDAGTGYTNYAWSTGATTQTISVNTQQSYTVTVTDGNGCSASASRPLTVNPLPSPAITGTTAFCSGLNSTLNAGVGFTSYLWTGGATTQTINVTTGGLYTVTVANNFGCTASTNVNITVHALPTPAITGPAGICTGSNAVINAGTYSSYQWSTGATTQTITVANAATYTVTVTDANGCTGSTNKSLVLFPLPTPTITGTAAICQGASSSLNAGAYSSYLWSTGATTATINATVAGPYTVTVTDANGCTNNTLFNLTVNALPTPAITGVTAFCTGASSTLNAGAGYTNYLWSTGATTQTVVVTGTATYAVTVTDGNGCTASTSQPVTAWALPTPVITGVAAICQGNQTTLSAGSYSSYVWSTGASTGTISTGAAGSYTVTVTDANGCINTSAAFNVTVHTLPTAVISNNSSICIGGSTSINVLLTGTPPFKYYYSNGTTTTGPVSSLTTSSTTNLSPTATTTYTLTQVSDNYCTGTFSGTAIVTVNPLPTPSITGVSEICDGETTSLAVNNYPSYLWSTGETTQTISVNSTANYICTVTDVNGCVNSTAHLLTVNQTPVISFTNDTSLTCEAPIIHFTNTSTYPAGSVFSWNFSDGALSSLENPEHQFSQSGNFPITLTIVTPKNCTATATNNLDIIFYPLPVARFTATPQFTSMYNSTIDLIDQSDNAVTWKWELGDGTFSEQQNVKHHYEEPGKHLIKLTVTNIAGCVSETENTIYITPFYIPNAFSPNADGKNEEFFNPGFNLDVKSYSMLVFNRWGQLIFETSNFAKGWNGTDGKGNIAPQGVYVYKLSIQTHSGKIFDYAGNVTLVR